ncbi:MAG: hypothetical protein EXS03_01575 [Phycisphaerales bacterium]|nr:hypothetical protein [Phycisphaerales bacterium]
MRGAGKTTVGKVAATRLGCTFIDLDDRVLELLGASSVKTVFEECGEAVWRDGEARALADTLRTPGAIVAVGAGAPEVAQCAELIRLARGAGWTIIHLDASEESIKHRIGRALGDRSPLTNLAPLDELLALARRRRPCYESLADASVDGSIDGVESVADSLVRLVISRAPSPPGH